MAIQPCRLHLCKNVSADLFTDLAKNWTGLLKEKAYRKAFRGVIKTLLPALSQEVPPHGEEVLQLIDILLQPAVASYHYQPSMLSKLELFADAGIFLQKRLELIQGWIRRK